MEKEKLLRVLGEFFLDSLREDAEDVDNWCVQSARSADDIVDAIATHLDGMRL